MHVINVRLVINDRIVCFEYQCYVLYIVEILINCFAKEY